MRHLQKRNLRKTRGITAFMLKKTPLDSARRKSSTNLVCAVQTPELVFKTLKFQKEHFG